MCTLQALTPAVILVCCQFVGALSHTLEWELHRVSELPSSPYTPATGPGPGIRSGRGEQRAILTEPAGLKLAVWGG